MKKEANNFPSFKLPKSDRLCSKKTIDSLFANGKSIFLYPFRIKYLPASDFNIQQNQFMVTIPKRNFKKAVDRNLLKRRIREAYRLNKSLYLNTGGSSESLVIAYIYIAKGIHDFDLIQNKIIETLRRLDKSK